VFLHPVFQLEKLSVLLKDQPSLSIASKKKEHTICPFLSGCAFKSLWERAKASMSDIFDGTSFQDLIDSQKSWMPV
jgi:DNA-binding IscR family transcriptional regulator